MILLKEGFIGKIRTAIDDIVTTLVSEDTFKDDVTAELWQATLHAATELSAELPINLLDVELKWESGIIDLERGSARMQLPDDFLRFVSLDVTGWAGSLFELIEPGRDASKMQRSPWGRGTATKPKAMVDHDTEGHKVILWWPGSEEYDNAKLAYIAKPQVLEAGIKCSIREEAERIIIYRAASIFFEGKKEETIAEKFRTLSTTY